MKEIWKNIPIKRLKNLYQVSNLGRARRGSRILKLNADTDGYLFFKPCVNGVAKNMKIHTAVCITFLGKRPYKFQINHKDTNKKNNKLSNLEYCSRLSNMRHAFANGCHDKRGTKNPIHKLTEEIVRNLRLENSKRRINVLEKATLYKTSAVAIRLAISGKTWRHI